MPYRIRYTEEARRALPSVPGNYRQRIRRQVEALATNPRPRNAVRVREQPERTDPPERYKITLDKWRLIYRVMEDDQMVRILRIRLKSGPETYHGLEE